MRGDGCLWIAVCRVFVGLASTSFAYLTSVRDTHKLFWGYGAIKIGINRFFIVTGGHLPGKAVKKV
jgi:hypothetical protein